MKSKPSDQSLEKVHDAAWALHEQGIPPTDKKVAQATGLSEYTTWQCRWWNVKKPGKTWPPMPRLGRPRIEMEPVNPFSAQKQCVLREHLNHLTARYEKNREPLVHAQVLEALREWHGFIGSRVFFSSRHTRYQLNFSETDFTVTKVIPYAYQMQGDRRQNKTNKRLQDAARAATTRVIPRTPCNYSNISERDFQANFVKAGYRELTEALDHLNFRSKKTSNPNAKGKA